jgi:hypothetical protein
MAEYVTSVVWLNSAFYSHDKEECVWDIFIVACSSDAEWNVYV